MPYIAAKCTALIPNGSIVHLGILNAVRNFNFFDIDESVDCFCNTGGFGIDGGISALVGSSFVDSKKLHFGVFGDLAFFYDMNCIGNRHVGNNIRIMVVNNASGTEMKLKGNACILALNDSEIDKYLAAVGHYKSTALIKDYATNLGFEYFRAESKESFEKISKNFFSPAMTDKPYLFEVVTKDTDEEIALQALRTLFISQVDDINRTSGQPAGQTVDMIKSENALPENTEEKLRAELSAIKNSFSYRLGRKLALFPRKLVNFIRRVK